MHSSLRIKDFIKSYFSGGVIFTLLLLLVSSAVSAEEKTITLTANNLGLSGSYATKIPTIENISFTIDKGMLNSNNIQMNNNKNGGNGILYNTTPIKGLKSITINIGKAGGTYTITTGTSTKPTTTAGTGTTTSTIPVKNTGDQYFQLKVSGACYFSSIVITYETSVPAFTISEKSATINAGETYDLVSKITKADGYNGTISYSSGDINVATINENGTIIGVGEGTTDITITASADGDFAEQTETFTITVVKPDLRNDPAFSWSPASYEPYFDTEDKTFPTLNKADGFNEAITYSSTNESVATINNKGEITILSAGETTITASFTGNDNWKESTASYTLNIKKRITELSFGTETTYNVNLGETFNSPKATAATKNNKEYDGTITYASSDANIADVNAETGNVEIKGAGTVTITATAPATEAWTEATANYTLTITDPNAPKILFYESFDKCNGTGGNDNKWSGSIASSKIDNLLDNEGWTIPNGYAANKCARFGTKDISGNPTTPEIAFEAGKTYTLTLKCGEWGTETPILNIKIEGTTATLSQSSINMIASQWNEATITITDISGPAKINFTGDGHRFFLDEIRVVEKKEIEPEPDLTLTFTKSVYTTYVAPCDIEFPTDLSGYIVTDVTENSVITEEIATAPMGTPVIIKAKELGTYNLIKAEEVIDNVTSNKLHASDGTITGGNNIYAMAVKSKGAGFYKVAETVTIPKGKAYLVWENAPVNNAKEFIPMGGETTGITSITDEDSNAGKVYYNLNGMCVDNPQKGIYIVNGKKVIF